MATGILASFWYYPRYDFGRIPVSVPLILDSGAFSAYTSGGAVVLEDYAEWVNSLQGRYSFAFNLDVLGEPEASFTNWERLRKLGVLTSPVIHYGDRPEDVLPRYIEAGVDRVSFGAIAVSGAGTQVRSWCAYVFRWLREHAPHLPTHGLGVHMRSRMANFPWTSTDSSAFNGAWRFARLALWDFRKGRWFTVPLDGRALYRHGALVRAYGFDPAQVALAEPQSRETLVKFATRIEVQAAEDWDRSRSRAPVARYVATKPGVVKGGGADIVAREIDRYLVDASSEHLEFASQLIDGRNNP